MNKHENREVIIVGAGGHGKVIADIVKRSGDNVIGFLDDKNPAEIPDFNVIGKSSDIGKKDCFYFVAVGNSKTRAMLMGKKTKWYTAIHPTAVIANGVIIGEGSCVMAGTVINPGAKIGKGCIINTGATVDHDCIIEDFVHVSVGAHIAGTVKIGSHTWIGAGAVVSNNVDICESCMIGAGAVVIKSISKQGTYIGVPAKEI